MKCPRCHEGDLFRSPLFPKFQLYDMHEKCTHCNLRYESEPGFWWGAMYIGYAFSSGALLIVTGLCLLVFHIPLDIFWWILGVTAVLGFAYNARLARSAYINLWVSYDAKYADAKIEK